jgi:DNA-binding CsgD family transcriptional regulator
MGFQRRYDEKRYILDDLILRYAPVATTPFQTGFQRRHDERRYILDDLILRYVPDVPVATTPFLLTDMVSKRFFTPVHRQIANEATDFGLVSYGTVPIHGPGAAKAQLTVAHDIDDEEFASQFRIERFELQLISSYVHKQVLRICPHNLRAPPIIRLSPRETEVLTWSANGKTVEEIAIILSISSTTCADYVKSACHKLRASNKAQAVAVAMTHGLITP